MSAVLAAGSKVYLSSALPATNDAAGYGALTWVVVGEVTEIGNIGSTVSMTEHTPLADGVVQKLPGSINNNALDMPVAFDADDAGQDLARTALYGRDPVSVKVELPDANGTKFYSVGYVAGFPVNIGNADAVLGGNIQIELNRIPVED